MVQKHGKAYLAHLQVHKSSVFKHSALSHTQTHVVRDAHSKNVCSPSSTPKLNRFLDKLTLVRCTYFNTHPATGHPSCCLSHFQPLSMNVLPVVTLCRQSSVRT
ncbi:hypothetical protein CHARACLAT_002490 [Characodon lateralis]|uniref:Uncharacterized protein n=1 Tax=Characodon lateralis TaxID=208331 RepID=A0ABU7D3I3_9TELE|nr:hypothetical protein [Characodon lateralis]